ncbi:MAG: hypothetical protein QOK37_1595 [Thermoanaerobaculia bacterium]|jgi:hypothetical protein|nr:hypothetical protein [Thermoanaerobaculia bacterium]
MNDHVIAMKIRRAAILVAVAALLCAPAAWPAVLTPDSVTVATVNGPQYSQVDVPVYIRDLSGTPLGLDQPPGSRIQAYSLTVNYSPASAVQSISFSRAGITTPLTPAFESSPSSAGSISLLDSFQESTNPIPFTLNAAAPGNQVAHLLVTLAPSATPGTVITLTLDPTLTQLSNDSGTTSESTTAATLTLVNGAITVVPSVPAMSHTLLLLLAVSLAFIGSRIIRF